ncbi:MAG: DUF2244 domain-containing protein [Hyphomicrobiaceae bacterium]
MVGMVNPGNPESEAVFEIWPHRSLGRIGTILVVGLAAIGCGLVAARTATQALPVTISALMASAMLAVAFWSNNRAARKSEAVRISPDRVIVTRTDRAGGPRQVACFSTHWVRVVVSQDRDVTNRLTLTESGRTLSIAEFLSPEERGDLAESLKARLHEARNRRFA